MAKHDGGRNKQFKISREGKTPPHWASLEWMLICVCINSPSAPRISRSLLPICLSLHSFSSLSAAWSLYLKWVFPQAHMVTVKGLFFSPLRRHDVLSPLLSVQSQECKADRPGSIRWYQLLNHLFRILTTAGKTIYGLKKSGLLYFKSGRYSHLFIICSRCEFVIYM